MNILLAILSAVANSLWQALAVAALVWLALRLLPRINAATRYAIWSATLGVVLILPIALRLILTMRPHPQPAAVTAMKTPTTAGPAFTVEPVIVTVAPGRTAIWPVAILAVWAAILLWRLIQIVRSYFFLRSVKRRAAVSPIPLPAIPRHADLLISPDIVSPMAVGFLRPTVVLPESLLEELSEPEREHVLLHESAHLAKYDDWSNLAMRLLAGALALHPVAIWILWRIEREREMACDDWVVARTGAARPYAASLAHLFELRRARRGEILASGIFGSSSRLGDRIEMLLRRGRTFSLSASAAGVVASTVVLSGLVLAGSLAPRWIAFAQQPAEPSFEVTSIKPSHPLDGKPILLGMVSDPSRLKGSFVTLTDLIARAYGIDHSRISGGPPWVLSDHFEVIATLPQNTPSDRIPSMLQALLAQRFGLVVRRDSRITRVYALVPANGGPKLKPSEAEGSASPGRNPTPVSSAPILMRPSGAFGICCGKAQLNRVSMERFAVLLSGETDRPVRDETGIQGVYDISLDWTPEAASPQPGRDTAEIPSPTGPSIYTAVQEQLGLRLEPRSVPLEYVVIEHVEKPDAN